MPTSDADGRVVGFWGAGDRRADPGAPARGPGGRVLYGWCAL